MKKTILATSLALLLTAPLLLGGCADDDSNAPDGYQTASNERVQYHLYVPNDWVVDTDDDSMMASARVSDYQSTNLTMMAYTNEDYEVTTDEAGNQVSPVPAYWADYQTGLSRLFDADAEGNSTFRLNEDASGKSTLVGNMGYGSPATGYTYVYTGTMGGVELQYMQVIIYQKDTFYIVTYTSTPDQYENYVEEVNEILSYIELP